MTFKVLNRVRMALTGAAGTGALTLASAQGGFQTIASAGANDGDTASYMIEDGSPLGTSWEIGVGTYHSSGTTFTRDTIIQSSAGGTTAISVSSSAIFSTTIQAQDVKKSLYDLTAGVPAFSGMTAFGAPTFTTNESPGKAINLYKSGSWSYVAGYSLAAPGSSPYRVAMMLQGYLTDNSSSSGYVAGWMDAIGKMVYLQLTANGQVKSLTNSAYSGSSSILSENSSITYSSNKDMWIGLHNDGTYANLEFSIDGVNFCNMGHDALSGGYLADHNKIFWGWLNAGYDCSLTLRCLDVNGLTRTFP